MLTTYLWPQRGRVALLAALLIAGVAVQLINPQIIRTFIDATVPYLLRERAVRSFPQAAPGAAATVAPTRTTT